jgi:hypothetical protein
MPMTKLEAVNEILAAVQESPVTALDTGGDSIEGQAESRLDAENLSVQSRGWHVNTEKNVELTPSGDDSTIALGTGVLSADGYGVDASRDVCVRGGTLFDRNNNTDEFAGPVTVSLVRLLDFDDLPQALQEYIVKRSSRVFQRRQVGDLQNDSMLLQEEQEASLRAHQEDDDQSNDTIIQTAFHRAASGHITGNQPLR